MSERHRPERAPFDAPRGISASSLIVSIAAAATALGLAVIISAFAWGLWHGVFVLSGTVLR